MDYETGSWWQELDTNNKVTTKVWDGKQDIYHLLHCLVIPRLPLAPGWLLRLPPVCWISMQNK
jgi:sulfoquinovose isomerase